MKTVLRRWSPRVCALLTVNALLVLGLIHEIWEGTETRELLDTAPRRGFTVPIIPVDNPPTTALNTIQERALFHATRTFFVAVDPHALPIPKPDYELVGTLIIPRKPTVALLKQRATSVSRKVKPGDDLDGWMVEVVENNRVVITNRDNRAEIARAGSAKGVIAGALRIAPLQRAAPRVSMSQVRGLGNTVSTAAPSPVVSGPEGRPQIYRPPP